MDIKFSKEELAKLVELIDIADWVLTSMDVEDDERKDAYVKLIQKIYAEAYKNGMTKAIEYDEEAKDYYPNDEWEESVQARDFIEEYEDATFWEELTYRLADRDIDRQLNGKTPKNVEEQIALFTKAQIKYEEEFEKNDLENLEIVKSAKAPSKKASTAAKKPAAKPTAKSAAKKPAPKGKKA